MDEAKKIVCVRPSKKNSEFYRGALARVTFPVSEVKEAYRILHDFAKIPKFREITRRGIFRRVPLTKNECLL